MLAPYWGRGSAASALVLARRLLPVAAAEAVAHAAAVLLTVTHLRPVAHAAQPRVASTSSSRHSSIKNAPRKKENASEKPREDCKL